MLVGWKEKSVAMSRTGEARKNDVVYIAESWHRGGGVGRKGGAATIAFKQGKRNTRGRE